MNNNQYTYNQPPMEQGMQMPPQPRMPIRQRMANGARRMQDIFPRWLSIYPVVTYILALVVVSFMYSGYTLPWYYMLSGVVAVMIFFFYGTTVVQNTSVETMRKSLRFERRIFLMAFILRVLFTLLIYWIFQVNYHDAFGFENGDALYYDELGKYIAELIEKGDYHFYDRITKWSGHDDISDMGYGVYVGFVYWLTDNSVIVVRLLKCLLSSITVLLIYRLAKRNFGEQTARVAAIFCALWPNFWYYCSAHLKETEMVFLVVLFVEQADQMLRSRQFTAWKVIPILLLAAAMFTFRTPLGLVALLSLVFSVVMSSSKVVSWGKRIIVGALTLILIGITVGNRLQEETQNLVEQVQSGQQRTNMEWRSEREDDIGNKQSFAKYAGAAVFAPMILTIPFPTMADTLAGQDVQQLLNGGNFVKNIMSFFVIISIFVLLTSGQWREHMFPLAIMFGYLVVLVMSPFAHSERFHQPVVPFEFIFAAYGLSVAVTKMKYKRWYTYWCVLMFIAAIAWNWFKLAGRGLA